MYIIIIVPCYFYTKLSVQSSYQYVVSYALLHVVKLKPTIKVLLHRKRVLSHAFLHIILAIYFVFNS